MRRSPLLLSRGFLRRGRAFKMSRMSSPSRLFSVSKTKKAHDSKSFGSMTMKELEPMDQPEPLPSRWPCGALPICTDPECATKNLTLPLTKTKDPLATRMTVGEYIDIKSKGGFISTAKPPMSPNIIPKHYSMKNAARLMVERDVNSCLVSSEREVVGIISSRDFVQKAKEFKHYAEKDVGNYMTPHFDCVTPHTTIDECISAFLVHEYRHLPVCLDTETHQVKDTFGVVSPNDMIRALLHLMSPLEHPLLRQEINGYFEMETLIHSAQEDESVLKCLQRMNDVDVGCLVVEDECGHMQGIFTEKDYLKNVFNKGLQSQTTKVADVMRKVPVVASQYFTFRQIMSIFSEEGQRHLPIVGYLGSEMDMDSRCLSVLTSKNVLRVLADPEPLPKCCPDH